MISILFIVIQNVLSECVENSFMTFPKSAEWVYAVKRISIRLDGEYIVGYDKDYIVRDKSKIQIKQVPQGITFGPSNFEIYCPAIHVLPQQNKIKCEIQLNMKEINATSTPEQALFIIPISVDDDLRENPVFQIDTNFQLRLQDLATQLQTMAYYLEYDNCDQINYLLPKPLPISADQLNLLLKYSTALPADSPSYEIYESNKGELYVENFAVNSSSNTHLYGLIAIIIGVVVLAVIRAFRKRITPPAENEQPLNQEMTKLT